MAIDRTKFFAKVQVDAGDGIVLEELDFMDTALPELTLSRDPLYYRVESTDLAQPDNIAFKVYGQERYWWVICMANGIKDCCVDLSVGQLLKVPDLLDVYDFFKRYRKR
jgi:hypothetical protein